MRTVGASWLLEELLDWVVARVHETLVTRFDVGTLVAGALHGGATMALLLIRACWMVGNWLGLESTREGAGDGGGVGSCFARFFGAMLGSGFETFVSENEGNK